MDFQALKTFMEERLEDFNMEPGVIAMDLVLFRDAIEHGNYMPFRMDIFADLCYPSNRLV